MNKLEKDFQICNAATDGPWEITEQELSRLVTLKRVQDTDSKKAIVLTTTNDGFEDLEFIAHFNPKKVREMLKYIKALEEALELCAIPHEGLF